MTKHICERPLIIQCPLCKSLTPMKLFSTSQEGLNWTCSVCEKELFSAATVQKDSEKKNPVKKKKSKSQSKATLESEDISSSKVKESKQDKTSSSFSDKKEVSECSDESEQHSCPKCFAVLSDGMMDCPKCGLSFENIGVTFNPEQLLQATNSSESSALMLWDKIEQDWESSDKHDAFIQFCHAQDMLDRAALHYRKILSLKDEREQLAKKRLERIVELVQQQFLVEQHRRDSVTDTVQRGRTFLILGILGFAVLAFYIIWQAMSGGSTQIQIP